MPQFLKTSSASKGGEVELWLDAIGTGTKLAVCKILNTGNWDNYRTFSSRIKKVKGRHDVYLMFKGNKEQLFKLKSLVFAE